MLSRIIKKVKCILVSDAGSSMVELAIVFPILLLLFAGCAELGRLFYTYTTLAKATEVGARYLSNSKDISSTNSSTANAAKLLGQNMVVCGYTSCTNKTPVVTGLTTSNVTVTVPVANDPVQYVKVEITGYNYQAAAFNIANLTGKSSSIFYHALNPATKMRYMP